MPLKNPYSYAQSYIDWKTTQPLFIEGGDPFDYSGGCTSFGMPISCTDAAGYLSRGLGALNQIESSSTNPRRGPTDSGGASLIVYETIIQTTHVWTQGGDAGIAGVRRTHLDTRTRIVNLPRQGPQNSTRLTGAQVGKLEENLQKLLDDRDCGEFINAMLRSLPDKAGFTTKYDGSLTDIFKRIKNGGGFWSGDAVSQGGLAITDPNTLTMTWDNERETPLITGAPWQQLGVAVYLVHELTHVYTTDSKSGAYGHEQMADAAFAAAAALNIDLSKELGIKLPSPEQFGTGKEYDQALNDYFNKALGYNCRKVKL